MSRPDSTGLKGVFLGMDTQVPQGGEKDERRCAFLRKDGSQCQGMKGSTGYCAGHARSMGLLKPRDVQPEAASSGQESIEEHAAATAAAQDLAQLSLSRSAAAWLASPKTQKRLQKRWDDILDNGSDAELIRLVKELTDRVEGRAGEAKVEEERELPTEVAELRRMSTEELIAALRD